MKYNCFKNGDKMFAKNEGICTQKWSQIEGNATSTPEKSSTS